MNSLNIRRGDTVIVLSGKEKGKHGRVLSTIPKEDKVIVEGVNFVTKHAKPRGQTDPGGIRKQEGALYACKVMRICPKCKKPTRAAHALHPDGTKTRVCKKCGDVG